MNEQKDSLDELFVNEDETLSNEAIKGILIEYVQFTQPHGKIFLLPTFDKLDNEKKMLVLLLAKKALKIKLGLEEGATPKELQDITGLGTGTVSPTLTTLLRERLVSKDDGKYTIPNYAIHKIKESFNIEPKK